MRHFCSWLHHIGAIDSKEMIHGEGLPVAR